MCLLSNPSHMDASCPKRPFQNVARSHRRGHTTLLTKIRSNNYGTFGPTTKKHIIHQSPARRHRNHGFTGATFSTFSIGHHTLLLLCSIVDFSQARCMLIIFRFFVSSPWFEYSIHARLSSVPLGLPIYLQLYSLPIHL